MCVCVHEKGVLVVYIIYIHYYHIVHNNIYREQQQRNSLDLFLFLDHLIQQQRKLTRRDEL